MPYRGPPSKGCLTCRKRKIRCDQRPGICQNCEKAKRECGGYRDAVDMMFLDETQESSSTSNSTPRHAGSAPLPISLGPEQKTFSGDVDVLPTQLETQAMEFFFTHFTPQEHRQNTFFESAQHPLSNLSASAPDASSLALYNSVLALGLISLYHFPPEPLSAPLPEHASAKYLAAVRALNRAICDPYEVKKDATVLAVTILIMYETFANPDSKSPDPRQKHVSTLSAWSNHAEGAAALLEIRGPAQFATIDGRRLFVQAAIPICVNCMQRRIDLPECISDLTIAARTMPSHIEGQPGTVMGALWRCFEFTVKYTAFWGKTRHPPATTSTPEELTSLVSMAVTLDEEAVGAAHTVLGSAPRRVIQKSDLPPGSFDYEDLMPLGYCHEYALFNMAELSNGIRAMRVQVNQLIRSILLIGMTRRPPMFSTAEHTTLLQHATDTMRAMTDGIVASVPQYLATWMGRARR
ncbi:uncharacterized protein AB675_5630 [Cyphellophora attinorum]|uniref:Zn(2)-C6 fungal-type domain-containing protein n=1 Tax=Cyphellophora attinorum TaxID=1664694 RepID=A0A0N1H739_9EURO|nr:uncharacterized protein AB675_5630 [Phialophora attinorum]KPI42122.1 hypothetical protein AB675_5630 [Phialophora attinorum]